jgi:type III secretion protein V
MRKDIALIALIVASLALMVIPLSPVMIDILLAVNISLAVILLMVSVYLKHPSDFSTFPSVILIGTAFRLALSIGTTRLILTEGEAGEIIETFGQFVVGGSIAVGLVIFLIITVVQFIVVTKGAERVAEVGARFALDALPGKQMSIDAEARAGNITADDAVVKRRRLDRDSRFFGAMDGAMKFVKGDAIAGLIIIFVNLIGGVAVGMSAHGFSFAEAVHVFSLLTIGDGLVAQIPALLMSLCAGIIVTRSEGRDGNDLGSDISAEMVADPRVTAIGAPIIFGMGFIPGFPLWIFATMAGAMLVVSSAVRRSIRAAKTAEVDAAAAKVVEVERARLAGAELPVDDRVRVRIDHAALGDVDVAAVAHHITGHLGALYAARGVRFPRPVVEACDLPDARGIVIEIDEVPVFRDVVPAGHLAVLGQAADGLLDGKPDESLVRWPLIDCVWRPAAQRAALKQRDVPEMPVDQAVGCLAFRVYEQNLGSLFSNAVYSDLMADAREAEPDLMEKIEEALDQGALFKVFRYLVEDGVPLRPMGLVVSSMRYWLTTLDEVTPTAMAECLRRSLKRQLCHRIAGAEGVLGLALLGPELEAVARQGLAEGQRAGLDVAHEGLALTQDTSDLLIASARRLADRRVANGRQIALVVAPDLRRRVRNFLASHNVHIAVLSPQEIATEIPCYPLELIEAAPDKAHDAPSAQRIRRQPLPDSAAMANAEAV